MARAAPQINEDEYSHDAHTGHSEAPARRRVKRNYSSASPHAARAASSRATRRPTSAQRVLDHADAADSPAHYEATQRVARVRARRAHKPFRLSMPMAVMSAVLLAQLMALLWIKSLALEAMHRSDDLGDAGHGEIGRVNEEIAQTQKQIARLSSPAQIKRWADARGWRMATPEEFDDVTKLTPYKPAASTQDDADRANEAGTARER
jgi:hypothetical protein